MQQKSIEYIYNRNGDYPTEKSKLTTYKMTGLELAGFTKGEIYEKAYIIYSIIID